MSTLADELIGLWSAPQPPARVEPSPGPVPPRSDDLGPVSAAAWEILQPPAPRAWRKSARPEQLPPDGDEWLHLVQVAGRGWGKSFSGSNILVEWALEVKGDYAAVGPTFSDARKIMTEGETGIIAALGADLDHYHRGDFILHCTNGSRIILASADAPERLRGLNLRGAWLDEMATMKNTRNLWDFVLMPALRKGRLPRTVTTTTPRRGCVVLRELLDRAEAGDPAVHVTRGATFDNAANLSPAFIQAMRDRYAGTTTGQQELEGIMLDDVEGALLSSELINATRVRPDAVPIEDIRKVVVGIDPAVSNTEGSDHTGIVVCALGPGPADWSPPSGSHISPDAPHVYVLADGSLKASPEGWGRTALQLADEWDAETIAAETNQGGDLVSTTLRMIAEAEGLHIPTVHQVTASRGKQARAEPVAGLFQQHRAHIVGELPALEVEWTGWAPHETTRSPDRLDAHVWATVELLPELAIKSGTKVQILS